MEEKRRTDLDEVEETQKKKKSNANKAIIYVCLAICIGAVIGTVLKPDFVSKLNFFNKNMEEAEVIVEEEIVPIANVNTNCYEVKLDTYYALGIGDILEGDFENYYAYTAPGINNGVVDQLENLTYYFSDSPKKYEVLNPEVESPQFYLLVKVRESKPEWRQEWGYDAGISLIILRNKTDNSMVQKKYEPSIKFKLV